MERFNYYSTSQLHKLKQQLILADEFEQVIEIDGILLERASGQVKKCLFTTEIEAIDQSDGKLKRYMFVNISAYTFEEAEQFCRERFPYAKIGGKLVAELPEDPNSGDEYIEYED